MFGIVFAAFIAICFIALYAFHFIKIVYIDDKDSKFRKCLDSCWDYFVWMFRWFVVPHTVLLICVFILMIYAFYSYKEDIYAGGSDLKKNAKDKYGRFKVESKEWGDLLSSTSSNVSTIGTTIGATAQNVGDSAEKIGRGVKNVGDGADKLVRGVGKVATAGQYVMKQPVQLMKGAKTGAAAQGQRLVDATKKLYQDYNQYIPDTAQLYDKYKHNIPDTAQLYDKYKHNIPDTVQHLYKQYGHNIPGAARMYK